MALRVSTETQNIKPMVLIFVVHVDIRIILDSMKRRRKKLYIFSAFFFFTENNSALLIIWDLSIDKLFLKKTKKIGPVDGEPHILVSLVKPIVSSFCVTLINFFFYLPQVTEKKGTLWNWESLSEMFWSVWPEFLARSTRSWWSSWRTRPAGLSQETLCSVSSWTVAGEWRDISTLGF